MVESPDDFNVQWDLKITVMNRIPWSNRWLGIIETKKTKQTTQSLTVGLFNQVHLFRQKVPKPEIHPF